MSLTLAVLFAAAAAGAPALLVTDPSTEIVVLEPKPALEDVADPESTAPEPPSAALAVKKGDAFRKVDLKGVGDSVTASEDGKEGEHGCGAMKRGLVTFSAAPPSDGPYILVPGSWDAAPKAIVIDDVTKPEYQAIVDAALAANGVAGSKASAGQAVKADLDGDGTDEIIVSATNVAAAAEKAKIGDYAVVAVQRVKAGKPETIGVLVQAIDQGNVDLVDMPLSATAIIAIADIDGDRKMEIVTLSVGMEEHSADAWSIQDDGSARIPFQAYCGV